MKYLKITNEGELNKELFYLIGASTKKNDDSKIGQFGTGLKYAISYFIRNGINIRFFIGENEIKFSTVKREIDGNEFNQIELDGKSMNITTDYGYQWKAWEVVREIWCNAKDAGIHSRGESEEPVGVKGLTSIFIEMNEEVEKIYQNWSDFFISEKPIFENENYAVYENKDQSNCRIYKNGILVKNTDNPSLFHYDFKKATLNELRQYMGYEIHDIPKIILNSNRFIVDSYIKMISDYNSKDDKEVKKLLEYRIDFTWLSSYDIKDEIVNKLFKGRLYMHPDSNGKQSNRSVKVNKELFDILKAAGLQCEKVNYSEGSSYGGGGTSKSKVNYKEFKDDFLFNKINHFVNKHNKRINFKIVMPISGDDFDFMSANHEVLFNANLSVLNDKDLEVIVVTALIEKENGGIYSVFKRLLKMSIHDRHMKKIIFQDHE